MLNLGPDLLARVIGMKPAEFPKDLAGALIVGLGRLDGHLDNLVAALIGARIQDALLPQPEALPVLRALGNLEQRTAIDCGDFDFGPQRRLPYRKGYLNFNIIAFALEERMLLHLRGNV